MSDHESRLYADDFLAELGLLKCTLCGKLGKEEEYRRIPIDEPRALGWVCLRCLEQQEIE